MKTDQVPQDNCPSYYGQRRVLYATDAQGRYTPTRSTGWEVETDATRMAVEAIHEQTKDAWDRARSGNTSPLEYYMLRQRMDLTLLAQTAGIFQWRIRRHFRPGIFAKLPNRVLKRYADAMGVSLEELKTIPDRPLLDIQVKSEPGVTRH